MYQFFEPPLQPYSAFPILSPLRILLLRRSSDVSLLVSQNMILTVPITAMLPCRYIMVHPLFCSIFEARVEARVYALPIISLSDPAKLRKTALFSNSSAICPTLLKAKSRGITIIGGGVSQRLPMYAEFHTSSQDIHSTRSTIDSRSTKSTRTIP